MARKNHRKENRSPKEEKKNQSQGKSSERNDTTQKEDKTRSQADSDKNKSSQEDATQPSETNDPEWYSFDPQVLSDAGSIPFSDVMGTKVVETPPAITFTTPEGDSFRIQGPVTDASKPVPGICGLNVRPTFGNSEDRNDPANVAAFAIYTHVRYNNSGRKNYDQADLFIYNMAASDLYAYINWMIRIYNCAFMYSQRNLYIGKALLEIQGIDPQSVIENLPAFRYWINVFINKVASYAVPGSIPLFKKRAFLYSMIYTESDQGSVKDQLYLYKPTAFYRFTVDERSKGMLTLEYLEDTKFNRSSTGLTIKGLEQIGDLLLSDVWGDEDFGIMSGDILRAFNGDIVTLSQIGAEGGIVPMYDPYVLHQMKNSRIVGPSYHTYNSKVRYRIDITPIGQTTPVYQYCKSGNVYQDLRGNIVCKNLNRVKFSTPSMDEDDYKTLIATFGLCGSPVISVNTPVVDPALIAEVTRNMPVVTSKDALDVYTDEGESQEGVWVEYDPGDLVIESCDIMYKPLPNLGNPYIRKVISNYVLATNANDTISDDEDYYLGELLISAIGAFHYMPIMFGCAMDTRQIGIWEITSPYAISDLNNYTVQSAEVIKRLHTVCMLSLLYVPGVAKSVNYLK